MIGTTKRHEQVALVLIEYLEFVVVTLEVTEGTLLRMVSAARLVNIVGRLLKCRLRCEIRYVVTTLYHPLLGDIST